MKLIFLTILLLLTSSLSAKIDREKLLGQYKPYPFDEKPLVEFKAEWNAYLNSYKKLEGTGEQLGIEGRKKNIELLNRIHVKKPKWIEGYWLLASELFQLASSYPDEKDLPLARKHLVVAREKTRSCLKIQPKNPLCKFFLASALGKIGTIDGVFASLKGAKEVEDLWLAAKNSPYNHFFTDRISMQGSVRYAFGIFYRLIPDWAIISWFFNVRGDLDKSVRFLEEALALDGAFPCSKLMLASSLLCRADGDKSSKDFKRGIQTLDSIQDMENLSIQSEICKADAIEMKSKPEMSCGYSTAKQQEEPDEDAL